MSRLAIASDHAGYDLKQTLLGYLRSEGHDLTDLGTDSHEPVDYPDYAFKLGEAIRSGRFERGILICGSGVGASVAACKVRGIRAAVCHDVYSAHQGVEHDDMNVLVLGARIVGVELAKDLAVSYLRARFDGAERHGRRLDKIRRLEGIA
jgi:RpiB/LacA/LacB family sugar-phosphate isomerase